MTPRDKGRLTFANLILAVAVTTMMLTSGLILISSDSSEAASSGSCGPSLNWSIDSSGNLTITGSGEMNYMYGVTKWDVDKVKTVSLPDGLTTIGGCAFEDCVNLTSVVIPDSVKTIEMSAFYNCTSLSSVTFGNSLERISYRAFCCCYSLTSLTFPDSLKYIEERAFQLCKSLATVTLNDSLKTMGEACFDYCKLVSVDIPDSVTSISDEPFYRCTSLTAINVGAGNTSYSSVDGVLYNKEKTKLIQYPSGKTDETYTMPDTVTSIGKVAISICSSLKSIVVGESNTAFSSENGALLNKTKDTLVCVPSGIVSYTIPAQIATIKESAFTGNTLKTIEFPAECVVNLEFAAIDECGGLEKIIIKEGAKLTFEECSIISYVDGIQTIHVDAPSGYKIPKSAYDEYIKMVYDNAPSGSVLGGNDNTTMYLAIGGVAAALVLIGAVIFLKKRH